MLDVGLPAVLDDIAQRADGDASPDAFQRRPGHPL
jgi:hypothetical protein